MLFFFCQDTIRQLQKKLLEQGAVPYHVIGAIAYPGFRGASAAVFEHYC